MHVEEWQIGAPPGVYDGPYWRAGWWARVPAAKRRSMLRHTDDGDRFDDFAIRQEWWTGEALPEAKVVRRELAGVPKIEVVGLSKEKVEEMFWDAVTQARADLAGVQRNSFRCLVRRMERNEHSDSTLPQLSVMMTAWINVP